VVQSILSREGARVALVKDGKKMIDTLQEQSFDLVISDVQMPKMSGLEAVKWVRKNLHQPIKIVALTANALPEEKEKCFKAGFDQVIFKPFKKEELMSACINNLQDKKSASSTPVNDKARKLYDLELLSEMVEHDKNQMDYLLQQFFKETPRKLTKLKKALADKNKTEIRKIAHYLSSSVHHLGIDTVFEAVDLLENGKLDRSPKKMQDTVISLIEQLHKALVQLKKDMGREKGPSKIK
jgi:CheY-like chemotaxis protein